MILDAALLSRLQFAFTVGFHIIFPTLTIGLAWFLALIEGLWLRTGNARYFHLYQFWVKVFALSFGMGVVSGVVLSYQFGTNFSRFTDATGNVIGSLLGYEVLTAFFLEASFLGVMLFGWRRVPPPLHFAATVIVAIGTTISAFWILAANSWMHTPAGYTVRDGIFYVESWWEVIFNPSFPYRFTHMMLASFLSAALLVAGVAAWHLLRDRQPELARPGLHLALLMIALSAPAQVLVGDLHGLQVQRDQPIKVAAMEGAWETERGAPLLLFAWPDQQAEENRFAIGIPRLASLILQHDPDGEIVGLKSVPAEDRPRVAIVFWAFRVMVGLGFLFLFIGLAGSWLWWRGRLERHRNFLRLCVVSAPLGIVAMLAGWTVTETGRQPWIVQGLMRTADAISPVPAQAVLTSLSLFIAVYGVLLLAYLFYLGHMIHRGPDTSMEPPDYEPRRTAWLRPDPEASGGSARG